MSVLMALHFWHMAHRTFVTGAQALSVAGRGQGRTGDPLSLSLETVRAYRNFRKTFSPSSLGARNLGNLLRAILDLEQSRRRQPGLPLITFVDIVSAYPNETSTPVLDRSKIFWRLSETSRSVGAFEPQPLMKICGLCPRSNRGRLFT